MLTFLMALIAIALLGLVGLGAVVGYLLGGLLGGIVGAIIGFLIQAAVTGGD
jgi:hypothetical protein